MALCDYCEKDMLQVDACTWATQIGVEFPDQTTLPAIPFPASKGNRCPDCNVAPGHCHHPRCDQERCPRCKGQLLSCGCLDTKEDKQKAVALLKRMEAGAGTHGGRAHSIREGNTMHIEKSPTGTLTNGPRTSSFSAPYQRMVAVFGEPYRNGEPDYPDDEDKTDVCWHLLVDQVPVVIWNYKNGPAYHYGRRHIEAINSYSVYCVAPLLIAKLQRVLDEDYDDPSTDGLTY